MLTLFIIGGLSLALAVSLLLLHTSTRATDKLKKENIELKLSCDEYRDAFIKINIEQKIWKNAQQYLLHTTEQQDNNNKLPNIGL